MNAAIPSSDKQLVVNSTVGTGLRRDATIAVLVPLHHRPQSQHGPQAGTEDPALAHLIACGAAAHPGIDEAPALRAQLAACLAQGVERLEARAADLYLATACLAGHSAAIGRLRAGIPTLVRPLLVRLGVPVSDHDEILQRVCVALIVRDEAGGCALARYSGRGELRAYVRAIAGRIALQRLEREGPPPPADHHELLAALSDAGDSPELALLKQRCRDDLRTGFAAALAALRPRERTLLRQHYVDGLTVEVLGQIHRVHRATCARWIDAARVKIVRAVRRHLRTRVGLEDADLETLVALVRSQLDLSLPRHLQSCST